MYKFLMAVVLFIIFKVASQFGSTVLVPLDFLLEDMFLPISAFTFTPLLICTRSFAQYYGEQYNINLKLTYAILFTLPLLFLIGSVTSNTLPLVVLAGASSAAIIGSILDLSLFRKMRLVSTNPVVRMAVSNTATAIFGSLAFYSMAYTNVLTPLTGAPNTLAQDSFILPAIVEGCIVSVFSVMMSYMMNKLRNTI